MMTDPYLQKIFKWTAFEKKAVLHFCSGVFLICINTDRMDRGSIGTAGTDVQHGTYGQQDLTLAWYGDRINMFL